MLCFVCECARVCVLRWYLRFPQLFHMRLESEQLEAKRLHVFQNACFILYACGVSFLSMVGDLSVLGEQEHVIFHVEFME